MLHREIIAVCSEILTKHINTLCEQKWPVLITKYYSGNEMEKNEMGVACSTYGGKERCVQDFGGGT
jgi:hypothetical protein